jgi:hypothetical protein
MPLPLGQRQKDMEDERLQGEVPGNDRVWLEPFHAATVVSN